jgi:hypothetical protein
VTLRPGEQWGEPIAPPIDPLCAPSDVALSEAVDSQSDRPLRVTGGDLATTIGTHRPRLPETPWRKVPVDRIQITTEHGSTRAVAHVVVRKAWGSAWRSGPLLFICNAEYIGKWDVAPRAHPGDGLLDVVEVSTSMSPRARFQAWRRVGTGSHIPHPDLRIRQITAANWEFHRPMSIFVDGRKWLSARQISVLVAAEDFQLHI